MSRLRRAILKYNELEEEDDVQLIDSDVQEDIILELRASLNQSKQPSSKFVNVVIGAIIVLNLMLLVIPYYKNKVNGILSLMSILLSLLNYIILKYEKYNLTLGRWRLLLVSFIMSLIILVPKLSDYQSRDLVYCVPLLQATGLYTMIKTDENLENEINSLEKLKYKYKEA